MADVQTGDLLEVKAGSYAGTWWWVRFVRKWDDLDEIMPVDLFDGTCDIRRPVETKSAQLETIDSAPVSTAGVPVLVAPKDGDEAEEGWGQEPMARARAYFDDRIAQVELSNEVWVRNL